jgi:Tfp pilus assembly protein PilE
MELMAVLLVVAILLLIAVASYIPASERAAATACAHNRMVLERAVSSYQASEESLVSSLTLQALRPFVENYDVASACPSDRTPYTLEPTSGSVVCPNHP